jgi:hypothetical protein
MLTATINDPNDQCFPFGRELWNNPQVVYHGTWSVYSKRIETEGFGHSELPFDHEHIAAIMRSRELIGIGSYAGPVFFRDRPPQARRELSMTGNFWFARAYATDGGGEVVRIVLREAREFEALCSEDEKRLALKASWEQGLKESPGHTPTLKAVQVLNDKNALEAICRTVGDARQAIENVVRDGFPVVYAISAEPNWFGESWDAYLAYWQEGQRAVVELQCARDLVSHDRIIAKAMYPNGTDPDFMPTWIHTWDEAEALRSN